MRLDKVTGIFGKIMQKCDMKLRRRKKDLDFLEENFKQLAKSMCQLKASYDTAVQTQTGTHQDQRSKAKPQAQPTSGKEDHQSRSYGTRTPCRARPDPSPDAATAPLWSIPSQGKFVQPKKTDRNGPKFTSP